MSRSCASRPRSACATFLPVLETAARLGARHALVAGNDPEEARLTQNLAALCDIAAPLGIAPCLEPMPWTDAKNFAQGARIVGNAARETRACSSTRSISTAAEALPPRSHRSIHVASLRPAVRRTGRVSDHARRSPASGAIGAPVARRRWTRPARHPPRRARRRRRSASRSRRRRWRRRFRRSSERDARLPRPDRLVESRCV